MKTEIFRIENGRKIKEGTELLSGIYLEAYKGEMIGIILDHISEKQCLIDILSGQTHLDSGKVYIDDEKVSEDRVCTYLQKLIAIIERKSKLVENLTVAENIFVIRGGGKKYFINKKVLYRQAQQLFDDFNLSIQADARVCSLTLLDKTLVELLKAYIMRRKLIVLSDITTFLSEDEVQIFMDLVLVLKRKGVDFIIVENFHGLLFKYSNRIVVIQKGKTVRIIENKSEDQNIIYRLLLDEDQPSAIHAIPQEEEKCLEAKSVLQLKHIAYGKLVDVSLDLHQGEVVSLLYQEHESWQQLLQILQGEVVCTRGEMLLKEEAYRPRGIWDAIQKGVCFVEENPIEKMLFYDQSVLDNLCLAMSNKVSGLWMHKRYGKSIRGHMAPYFDEDFFETPLNQLPPVSLQKLIYSKWLLYGPKVVVCHKPFSMTDVHMRRMTQQMIKAYQERGIAVLIATSNVDEVQIMGSSLRYLVKGNLI